MNLYYGFYDTRSAYNNILNTDKHETCIQSTERNKPYHKFNRNGDHTIVQPQLTESNDRKTQSNQQSRSDNMFAQTGNTLVVDDEEKKQKIYKINIRPKDAETESDSENSDDAQIAPPAKHQKICIIDDAKICEGDDNDGDVQWNEWIPNYVKDSVIKGTTDPIGTCFDLLCVDMPKLLWLLYHIPGQAGNATCQRMQEFLKSSSYAPTMHKVNNDDFMKLPMRKWEPIHVECWVNSLGGPFPKHCDKFKNVNGKELLDTNIDELSLIITSKMQRRKFMKHLEEAKKKYHVNNASSAKHYDLNNSNINGVIGLYNLGNTCYMNTAIQLLSQTPKLTRYLAKRAKRNTLNAPMLDAWTEICDAIYSESKVPNRSYYGNKKFIQKISPEHIKNALNRIDNDFGSGKQDDAARALIVMLNALDEEVEMELTRNKKYANHMNPPDFYELPNCNNLSEHDEQMIVNELLRTHNPNQSIIKKLFDGVERLIYTCHSCHSQYRQYKIFRMLDIPVASNVILFTNVNVVINDQHIVIPDLSALDYCSIDILKHKIVEKMVDFDIVIDGIASIQIVGMQANGDAKVMTSDVTILELYQSKENIFALVDDKNNYDPIAKQINLLQFVELDNEVRVSTRYISRDTGNITKYIYKISQYFVKKNKPYKFALKHGTTGKFITDSKLKKLKLDNGDSNVLVLCLVAENCHDDKNKKWYKRSKHKKNKVSISKEEEDAISGHESDSSSNELTSYTLDVSTLFTSFKTTSKRQNVLRNMDECLKEYQNGITVDESVFSYKCRTCSEQCRILQLEKSVLYTPEVLILHLDRFGKNMNTMEGNKQNKWHQKRNSMSNKFTHRVNYRLGLNTTNLSIGKYSKNKYNLFGVSNHSGKYSLYGISNHSGNSTNFGHYTANVKCFADGKWYYISDSHVSRVSCSGARDYANATILMYS